MNPQTSAKIQEERQRQKDTWGADRFQRIGPEQSLAALMEEVGEVARAVINLKRPSTLNPPAALRRIAHLEAELIRVAAVAVGWLDDCFSRADARGLDEEELFP